MAVAGATGHFFKQFRLNSLPKGVRLLGRVEDDLLPALYSSATGFVYGSIYEGFGFPPLEALACGCPLAVSDIPPHREVCGSNALYFDAFNPHDLLSQLEKLLRLSSEERASRAKQGLQRAAQFGWERAAAAHWQVLQQEAQLIA